MLWAIFDWLLTICLFYSLPNRKHFYISPLKDSPFKAPSSPSQMTPRSRQLYSFGEGVGVSHYNIEMLLISCDNTTRIMICITCCLYEYRSIFFSQNRDCILFDFCLVYIYWWQKSLTLPSFSWFIYNVKLIWYL